MSKDPDPKSLFLQYGPKFVSSTFQIVVYDGVFVLALGLGKFHLFLGVVQATFDRSERQTETLSDLVLRKFFEII